MIVQDPQQTHSPDTGPVVSQDMASIFAGLDASDAQSRSASEVRAINPSGPARGRWPIWSAMGAIVAVAAFAASTMLPIERDRPFQRPVPTAPAARLATAAPPVTPPPLMLMAQDPEPPASTVEPTAALARPVIAKQARATRKYRRPAPLRKVRVARVTHHRVPGNCEGTIRMARARCMYPEVVAADDLLREAYTDAVRAGVTNRTLSRYQHRWARLRGKALTQPDRVARGFRELARDLRDLGADTDKGSVRRIAGAY